ncbi:MAG: ribosomal protein S18-alanine N-acetyltransferase [Desulfuromonadales bacterium]|nr:ribosomal protein S18-alanine N-acetyltransferase [Desulfuromonadales bacterium]
MNYGSNNADDQKPKPQIGYVKLMDNSKSSIIICPMTEADLDDVLVIERDSFPKPWLRQHFIDEIMAVTSFPFTAFNSEEKVIGYVCPMMILDEGHILNVAIAPSFRGFGFGKFLVAHVLKECLNRNASSVSLEVRITNQPAITLYKSAGFKETGIRKRYYENMEDALLMEYIFRENGELNAV